MWAALLTIWVTSRLWTTFAYHAPISHAGFIVLTVCGSLILAHEVLHYVGNEEN